MTTPSAPSSPLRIAILEADTPQPRTAAKWGGYGAVFSALLSSAATSLGWDADTSLSLTKYDVVREQLYPTSLDALDAILITGSKANAFDNTPWIIQLVEYVQKVLAQRRVRILGVCFGHQIVARALGAEVKRGEAWEASVLPMPLTQRGREVFEGREQLDLFQMHQDIVTALPTAEPDIENLGATELCAVHGMVLPGRFISVQGHPEFRQEIVEEILEVRKGLGVFTEKQYDEMMSRVTNKHDGVLVARVFLKFLLD